MKNIALFCLLIIFSLKLQSQVDTTMRLKSNETSQIDSTLFDLNDDDFDMKSNKFKIFNFTLKKPIIELQYGVSKASYDYNVSGVLPAKLSNLNTIELRIGDISISKFTPKDSTLIKTTHNNMFFKSVYGSKEDLANTLMQTAEGMSFGWNKNTGYGYKIGNEGMISLYHGNGYTWSFLNINNADSTNKLEDFGKNIMRFGKQFQSGIMISPVSHLNISLEYQRSMIFPRHMFWYDFGSQIVEEASSGVLSIFTNKIKKTSPELYPIVKFVFDTGLSYGFYELRKKDMNWPMQTASPLLIDSYKIGLSYTFN